MALIRELWLHLAACLVVGATAAAPAKAHAQVSASPEYQLKAVFLFNFAQFVEWPASAFAGPDTPLVIGVLGEDPFGSYLDETVRAETVNGRPLEVRRYRGVAEIGTCHILFVNRRGEDRLQGVIDSLRGRSILTVSDAEGFGSRGGMIRFVTDRNRIRLRINLEAAQAADLTLSSKLLRPAHIVSHGKD
jgi:uncharacterized protein DUF4154